MVLRIPSRSFDEAMPDLKAVPDVELDSANTNEDDVTTKVIDTRTRIEAQRRSIARITVLFDRAESIRDIMAIEAELSQRQADLDSLEQTAAYLAGQTTLSTIVVSIDQIPEKKAETEPETDEAGFVAGFKAGWDGLVTLRGRARDRARCAAPVAGRAGDPRSPGLAAGPGAPSPAQPE